MELRALAAASQDVDVVAKHSVLGENHLRRAVSEYVVHYHRERNHQSAGNRLITPAEPAVRPANGNALVERRERLGELLNFYYRRARMSPRSTSSGT